MSITAATRATDTRSERLTRGVFIPSPPQRAPLALGRRLEAELAEPVLAPTITTSRLLLRPHSVRDAEAWFRIQSDPEIVRFLPWPLRTAEGSRAHLERRTRQISLSKRDDFLALAVVLGGQLIGDVSMHLRTVADTQREVEAGWLVDSAFAGKGYAREAATALLNFAFTELGAKTASAMIDARNARSLALATRLGFVRESRRGHLVRLLLNHRMLLAAASATPTAGAGLAPSACPECAPTSISIE